MYDQIVLWGMRIGYLVQIAILIAWAINPKLMEKRADHGAR